MGVPEFVPASAGQSSSSLVAELRRDSGICVAGR